MHPILDHHEIVSDLAERLIRLAEASTMMLGASSATTQPAARAAADELRLQLKEPGGNAAAQRILTYLVPEIEKRGTDFWGTPLGRACGWWTGAGQLDASSGELLAVTPQPRVALLLGMSRQSAFEMVTKGKLTKIAPAGVSPTDVRREMQARYPL